VACLHAIVEFVAAIGRRLCFGKRLSRQEIRRAATLGGLVPQILCEPWPTGTTWVASSNHIKLSDVPLVPWPITAPPIAVETAAARDISASPNYLVGRLRWQRVVARRSYRRRCRDLSHSVIPVVLYQPSL
jgi:hypothetical protein